MANKPFLTSVRPMIEEALGRQTKLHPGFTLGKLVQPSTDISILRDSHIFCSNGLNNDLQIFLMGQWT